MNDMPFMLEVVFTKLYCKTMEESAYNSGLKGYGGYPLNLEEEVSKLEDYIKGKINSSGLDAVAEIVNKLNQAYARGCSERVTC